MFNRIYHLFGQVVDAARELAVPIWSTKFITCENGAIIELAGKLDSTASRIQTLVCPVHGDQLKFYSGYPIRRWQIVKPITRGLEAPLYMPDTYKDLPVSPTGLPPGYVTPTERVEIEEPPIPTIEPVEPIEPTTLQRILPLLLIGGIIAGLPPAVKTKRRK